MAHAGKAMMMGAVVLAVGILGGRARASLVTYSDVSSNGITISNITEDNTDNFTAGHYGQPVFVNGVLTFPSLQQFSASANGDTSSHSDTLNAKLTFTVTMPAATTTLFDLSEQGIFAGYGGASGSVVLGAVVNDGNGNPVVIVPSTGTVMPNIPFLAPGMTQTAFTWVGSLDPVSQTPLVTYTVALDNDLTATAPAVSAGAPATFADIEKKLLTITFPGSGGSPPAPEPASLSLLVIGGLGLLARRRR